MKERICILSNLTEEQINNMNADQASTYLEEFHQIKEITDQIWQLFKLFDIDTRDERTLEILTNHANGSVLKKIQELKKISASLFTHNNPLVAENAVSDIEKYKAMAEDYFEFKNNQISLRDKELLIANHLQELICKQSEENPTCKMQ